MRCAEFILRPARDMQRITVRTIDGREIQIDGEDSCTSDQDWIYES